MKTEKLKYAIVGFDDYDSLEDAIADLEESAQQCGEFPDWLANDAPEFEMLAGELETSVTPPECMVKAWLNMWERLQVRVHDWYIEAEEMAKEEAKERAHHAWRCGV